MTLVSDVYSIQRLRNTKVTCMYNVNAHNVIENWTTYFIFTYFICVVYVIL